MFTNLREYIKQVEELGKLTVIEGADWDLEVGAISALNLIGRKDCPALLFDNVKGYPKGYRIVTDSCSTPALVALTLNLPQVSSTLEMVQVVRQKLAECGSKLEEFHPKVVQNGPVLENIHSGEDINLFEFPVPKWNELDGGRYIGTGHTVITRDPDEGWVNLGTYRVMVLDRKTTCLYIKEGSHGRIHYEKYHKRGERCPIIIAIDDPLVFSISGVEVSPGVEYQFIGAVRGEPIEVITEEVTGLPMPTHSEIVLAGWCPPDRMSDEGPYAEWTGYYGGGRQRTPVIEVERVYHRNMPILHGSYTARFGGNAYRENVVRSALLWDELERQGIPDIKGVWTHLQAHRQFIAISIDQRYAGQSKQVGLAASQSRLGSPGGRYVVVVDDDIDPTATDDVIWAMSTRSDPTTDIDIIRRAVSFRLDPLLHKATGAYFNSRAIIDACKPYEWKDEFPTPVVTSAQLKQRVKNKWGDILKL